MNATAPLSREDVEILCDSARLPLVAQLAAHLIAADDALGKVEALFAWDAFINIGAPRSLYNSVIAARLRVQG